MMSKMRSTLGLWLVVAACDPSGDEGEAEADEDVLREGQAVMVKTQSQDTTFKWRGCDPWDPWLVPNQDPSPVAEDRIVGFARRDAPAMVIEQAYPRSSCEAACDTVGDDWLVGQATVETLSLSVGAVAVRGLCATQVPAVSADVQMRFRFSCACG